MIRVIYRWRIDLDHQEDFVTWWHQGTLRIMCSEIEGGDAGPYQALPAAPSINWLRGNP